MNAVVYRTDIAHAQADARLAPLRASAAATPFDRLEWFALLAEECLTDRACFLVTATDGDSHAALPLALDRSGEVSSLTNWYSFLYCPMISHAAKAAPLLTLIARDLARDTARVTLHGVPRAEAALLHTGFRKAGWIGFEEACDVNHVLLVGRRSFDEYWAARPGRLRETVRRKGRTGRVTLRIATSFTDGDWAAYEAVYRTSWKPEEGSPSFLKRFAQAEAARGGLRLGIAEIEGRPVAAQFWTVQGDTAFIHKLAHDDSAAALSPGTLLSHALFAHVIDCDGVQEIDFGTGNDAYKGDWMDTVRTRHRLTFIRPSAVRHWPALARRAVRVALEAAISRPLVSRKTTG